LRVTVIFRFEENGNKQELEGNGKPLKKERVFEGSDSYWRQREKVGSH
jgi:hypothetical protein